ncbi:unnamed protein product, partial [Acidithrix sp. C25]
VVLVFFLVALSFDCHGTRAFYICFGFYATVSYHKSQIDPSAFD